ncbi:MAG: 3-deoxy-D-manno-octulosonic acid transferase [Desulfopila sp.]
MLIFFYNIAQLILLLLAWPVLVFLLVTRKKYRLLLARRLGLSLQSLSLQNVTSGSADAPLRRRTIWLHALSLGEVTSAAPLLAGLRRRHPDSRIVVTIASVSGESIGQSILADSADLILPAPLDLLPVVRRYLRAIRPDIYILVETDFWPNLLAELNRRHVPALLVNGRISERSLTRYRRFCWFFQPMFSAFSAICLQSDGEKEKFRQLGIGQEYLYTLGNLKYDLPANATTTADELLALLPPGRPILVAGSTHQGEEESIFTAFRRIRRDHPELFLVVVPRRPERADEIVTIGHHFGLEGGKRTAPVAFFFDYLIVDTVGELAHLYHHCDIAFVGGSLVAAGGHNPLEAARLGRPVLFGPHMEDFQEIADELIACDGARSIADCDELTATLLELTAQPSLRQKMGAKAAETVRARQGVVDRHLAMIENIWQ